jgi:hypothetical protein
VRLVGDARDGRAVVGAREGRDASREHEVRTGLRVMAPAFARPTAPSRGNPPARPGLAPVPEWSPPYRPDGPATDGFPGFRGPARPTGLQHVGDPDGFGDADGTDGTDGTDGPGGSGGSNGSDRPEGSDRSDGWGGLVGSGGSGDHAGHVGPARHDADGGRSTAVWATAGPATAGPATRGGDRRLPALLLVLAFVLTAGIGITVGSWLGLPGRAGSGQQPDSAAAAGSDLGTAAATATGASLTPAALPATPPKTLKQALTLVNTTVWTTGYLPQKSCTFATAVSAKCSDPYPGITVAYFQNYSSPDALYAAYETAIKQANHGRFVVNTQDCGASAPPENGGEISWNHFGLHTSDYSIKQLESGKLNAASQAAGRMFCNYDSATNTEDIIWTETDGNMLGEVTGSPHLAVWNWWLRVHHNIAFNGQPMGAMDMAPAAFPKA